MFLGRILPEQLADILRISDLHIYLTAPFVLSWSLLNAMASGCVVLGSDVPPVREVIEPGQTGLIEPLFDIDGLTETALRVLDDPATFAPLGRAARALIDESYSLDVCIPPLKDFFERVASGEAKGLNEWLEISASSRFSLYPSQAVRTTSSPGSSVNSCSKRTCPFWSIRNMWRPGSQLANDRSIPQRLNPVRLVVYRDVDL